MKKRKMPKCVDCGKDGQITWDGIWLCKSCEIKRLKQYKQNKGNLND